MCYYLMEMKSSQFCENGIHQKRKWMIRLAEKKKWKRKQRMFYLVEQQSFFIFFFFFSFWTKEKFPDVLGFAILLLLFPICLIDKRINIWMNGYNKKKKKTTEKSKLSTHIKNKLLLLVHEFGLNRFQWQQRKDANTMQKSENWHKSIIRWAQKSFSFRAYFTELATKIKIQFSQSEVFIY